MRRHDDDARPVAAQNRRFQRWLHANDRHAPVPATQRRTSGARCRIAGKDDSFDAGGRHAVDLRRGQGADLSFRPLTVRRMGSVAKVNEIFRRQQGNKLTQHTDAAET